MNSAVHPQEPDVIVAGMGGSCCLMSLTGDAEDEGQGKEEESEGKETVGEGEEADREEEKEEEEEGEGETEGAIEDVRKQGSPRSRKVRPPNPIVLSLAPVSTKTASDSRCVRGLGCHSQPIAISTGSSRCWEMVGPV